MELLTILLSGFGDFLGTPIFDSEDFWKLITKTIFNQRFDRGYLIMNKTTILTTYLRSLSFIYLTLLITLPKQTFALEGLPLATPESVGVSSHRLEHLEESMQRYIDNEFLAGTVTLIARDGKIIHFKFSVLILNFFYQFIYL